MSDDYPCWAVLGGVGAGSLAGLAGCTGVLGSDRTQIGELVLLNTDEAAHRVRVVIESGDDRLFETTRRVPGQATAGAHFH